MSEYQIETRRRSRSRSKTPFLRSSCDQESCEHTGEEGHIHYNLKKKTNIPPSVETIIEEVVEVTSSSSSHTTAQNTQNQTPPRKTKTSDYSSEDPSPEMLMQQQQQIGTTSSTTTVVTQSKQVYEHMNINSGAATSTPKSNSMLDNFASQFSNLRGGARRSKEMAQNEINAEFERSQQNASISSNKSNNTFSRIFGSPFSTAAERINLSGNGDVTNNLAYLEYKRTGEYWNKTPKTDYTYSELSPHRRELAPGVIAMPNMSRRGLDSHHQRINYMVERDPVQEEFIRRRYEATKYTEKGYDSGDDVDYYKYKGNVVTESWWRRIVTSIVTIYTTVTSVFSTDTHDEALYRVKYMANEKRGFFGTIGYALFSVLKYIYLGVSSIMYIDSWLLQSSGRGKNKKRFLLLLLLLLPFLLLGAWRLLDEREKLYYLQTAEALLPLSLLASLRNTLQNTATSMHQGLFDLPARLKTATNQYFAHDSSHININLYEAQKNLQNGLTKEEYENLFKHVNSYMQQLVDLKMQEQERLLLDLHASAQISPQQTEVIVKIMRENLERVAREKRDSGQLNLASLSVEELENLANMVLVQLKASGWPGDQPIKFSTENLNEIKKLIRNQIEVNNHAHYTLLVEKIDLDALLARILNAPQLGEFIDNRIRIALDSKLASIKVEEASGQFPSVSVEEQKRLIDDLNKEIAFIKLTLSGKLSENEELHRSISRLEINQDSLLERLQEHQHITDQRFSAILAEIDSKLALLKEEHFILLNKQVKLSLVEILGFKSATPNGVKLEDIDLKNWVSNVFVAKDYLEQRLLEINDRTNNKIKDEIDRSGFVLMRDISERLKQEILLTVEMKQNESAAALKGQISGALSEEEVRKIVKSVLAIYDADKTGLVDFALESAGGQILSTRCTESYQTKSAQISVLGIPLWYPSNTPRTAISPNVRPGECWAFQGFPGYLVLKLNSLVYVTGFTLEHIPKSLSPSGRIDSAPKKFTVWGLEHEKDYDPVLFGEYEYVDNDASLQYFPVQNKTINRPYEIVEMRIESNHGHMQYTCLYRFRVHGSKLPAS